MRTQLKRGVLLVLAAWDGMPMPEGSVISAVQAHARPEKPTDADVTEALKDCESEGYISGVTDDFEKSRTWSLTEKGKHKARQLR